MDRKLLSKQKTVGGFITRCALERTSSAPPLWLSKDELLMNHDAFLGFKSHDLLVGSGYAWCCYCFSIQKHNSIYIGTMYWTNSCTVGYKDGKIVQYINGICVIYFRYKWFYAINYWKSKKHGGIPKLRSFQIFSPLCVIGVVWAIQLLECYTATIVQNIHCVVSQKLLLGAVGYELTR